MNVALWVSLWSCADKERAKLCVGIYIFSLHFWRVLTCFTDMDQIYQTPRTIWAYRHHFVCFYSKNAFLFLLLLVCLITAEKKACPPSQCGAPHPAGSNSQSSALLFSPMPPRLQCFPWWCCERQLAVNRSDLDKAISCVGGRVSEKNIPLNNNWHLQRHSVTVIVVWRV